MNFNDVVEAIQSLSTDKKQQIHLLLKQYMREKRREKFHENFKLAQSEQQKRKLKFSSDVKKLRKMLEK